MSWTTIEPSTPNTALVPPWPGWFKLVFITFGKLGANNGGTKPHSSLPVLASNACSIPLFDPA